MKINSNNLRKNYSWRVLLCRLSMNAVLLTSRILFIHVYRVTAYKDKQVV